MVSLNGQFISIASWRAGTAGIVQDITGRQMKGSSWPYSPAGHQGIAGGSSPT